MLCQEVNAEHHFSRINEGFPSEHAINKILPVFHRCRCDIKDKVRKYSYSVLHANEIHAKC